MLGIIKLRLLRLRDDFWVYVIMMIMAFGLTVVFGVSFDDYRPTVLIIDENNSSYSENLTNELSRNNAFAFVEVNRIDAITQVSEGKALAAVLIEDDFEAAVKSGNSVPLGVMKLKDDTLLLTLEQQLSSVASKMAGGVRIAEITADYIAIQQPMADRESVKETAYRSVMEAWEYKDPLSVASTVVNTNTGSGYDNLKHSMIGFSLFFSMYTMVFGIGTILYDRQYKTWQRMMITPVSKASILGGSMIVTYLAGAIQLGILVLAGKYLLGIDWGSSMAGILLIVAAFIFAITTMGLLLSGLVKTHAQLASITPVLLTSTSMLGGCMWPLDIVNNKILLFLAELTPQKWAIQGMEDIASKGMGFDAAVLPTLVLAAMGLIFFAGGVKLMKFE
ncbi:MAG TPA: ABC transporter permease [Anaerovoracaceae bacterium]|nr:ABC transporter permease [Anaerovoracaceae bacterium]